MERFSSRGADIQTQTGTGNHPNTRHNALPHTPGMTFVLPLCHLVTCTGLLTNLNDAKLNTVTNAAVNQQTACQRTCMLESRYLGSSFTAQWSLYVPDISTLERYLVSHTIVSYSCSNSYYAWRQASATDKWGFRSSGMLRSVDW